MLPVTIVLSEIETVLSEKRTAILTAPPGAGKTTVVPLALLQSDWLKGKAILMLQPRRLAARASARRMASQLNRKVGETVGFRVRGESRTSPATRIEVITEGIFTRRILSDPSLEGVGLVIFDEFHERSLEADLGLAFAREAQSLLRDDLRILVMSATLDGARIAELMPDAGVVVSEGRAFPVETHYLGRHPTRRLEEDVAHHVARLSHQLKSDPAESLLVFLPGQGEIHKVATYLETLNVNPHACVHKLFGALEAKAQDLVLSPNVAGQPKIVLATNIAETSVTVPQVAIVLDSGLARTARYDPRRSLTRLQLGPISRASADQRQGRAGRTQSGHCYRLWDEAQNLARPAFERPEILETDLSQLLLQLKLWGAHDTAELTLLDHPSKALMLEAQSLLQGSKALDDKGYLTPHGHLMADIGLSPRLAHMAILGAVSGQSNQAAELAVLLSEPDLGGSSCDLNERLERFRHDRGQRAHQMRSMIEPLAKTLEIRGRGLIEVQGTKPPLSVAQMVALAFPDRLAKRRSKVGEFTLRTGRLATLLPDEALAVSPWLSVAHAGGGTSHDRIFLAAEISVEEVLMIFGDELTKTVELETENTKPRAYERQKLGEIVVKSHLLSKIPQRLSADYDAHLLKTRGIGGLNRSEAFFRLQSKIIFAASQGFDVPDVTDEALLNRLSDWLLPFAEGKPLATMSEEGVYSALKAILPYKALRQLDEDYPDALLLPTSTKAMIDYGDEAGPTIEVRVQELFGLKQHPSVGPREKRVPLTLKLLSPARRPIQITRDLVAFWKGSWLEVRSEMKGRYPRHPWPENPEMALPTTRAKPRGT